MMIQLIDVIEVLTGTDRPRTYWSDLKKLINENHFEVSEKIGQLEMVAPDSRMRDTDCANTNQCYALSSQFHVPDGLNHKQ